MSELFRLSDQGGRELGLRFDLTVPLCRYVSMTKDLRMPFKRYEIGRVYRDGPIKPGRYREFWQCDADIVGSADPAADAECIKAAVNVLRALKMPFEIRVNTRAVLDAMLDAGGIQEKARVITIIDKLHKIGADGVAKELSEFLDKESVTHVRAWLEIAKAADPITAAREAHGELPGLAELEAVLSYLEDFPEVRVDLTLARGLNYYTGTIYEGFLLDSKVTSSVCAGGRYDNIIGAMRGNEDIPAVGISFGVEPLTDALIERSTDSTVRGTQLLIAPIGEVAREAHHLADVLRSQGVSVIVDLLGRSISKNLSHADKERIPLVLIVGERDLASKKVTLKNLKSGEEHEVPLASLEDFSIDAYL